MAIEAITFIALVLLILIFLGRKALSEGYRVKQNKKLKENLKKFDDERNR